MDKMGLSGCSPACPVPRSLLEDVYPSGIHLAQPWPGGSPLESAVTDKACPWQGYCPEGCSPLWVLASLRVWVLALTGQASMLLDGSRCGNWGTWKQRLNWMQHWGAQGHPLPIATGVAGQNRPPWSQAVVENQVYQKNAPTVPLLWLQL